MQRLTEKGIKKYLEANYGESRHNEGAMKVACSKLAKELKVKATHIFFYIIERRGIPGLYLTSYGFDTAEGRSVREEFEALYYQAIK